MLSDNEILACRVCGLTQQTPPWGEDGNTATFEICECCNVEFGYEDGSKESASRFRKNWLDNGGGWRGKDTPANWDREEQMRGIPTAFRVDEGQVAQSCDDHKEPNSESTAQAERDT